MDPEASPQPAFPTGSRAAASERSLIRIERQIRRIESGAGVDRPHILHELREMRKRLSDLTRSTFANLSAWEVVQVARHADRPIVPDYIDLCVADFVALHGDRRFRDDPAMITGLGRIGGHRVLVVGHNKGRRTAEKVKCGFGYAHPEGYRKALRTMKLAEKFDLPVICLIDTPGAHPGPGAEARGIAPSIASNLIEMSRLRVPIVCVVVGEGGSGGALGIGVGDRVAMMEYAYYSVITPEGCAAILFDDADKSVAAAGALRVTAPDLQRLGVIDDIISEPVGGAHRDPSIAARNLERYLRIAVNELATIPRPTLLNRRYQRLRAAGACVARSSETEGLRP